MTVLILIFFYFSEKTSLDILCESSAKQTIHRKYQDLFSLKNKNKTINKNLESSATNFAWPLKVYYRMSDSFSILISCITSITCSWLTISLWIISLFCLFRLCIHMLSRHRNVLQQATCKMSMAGYLSAQSVHGTFLYGLICLPDSVHK